MRKSAALAFKTANEWKARGFKSSKANSDESATSVPSSSQQKERHARRGEEGETIKRTWKKPENSFKIKEETEPAEPLAKKPKTIPRKDIPTKAAGEPTKGKPKKKVKKPQSDQPVSGDAGDGSITIAPSSLKKKKNKKVKPAQSNDLPAGAEEATEDGEANNAAAKPNKRKKQKFKGYCLFVGNLSYETTKEDLLKHFSVSFIIRKVTIFHF